MLENLSVSHVAMWLAIVFVVLGGVLGVAGVWIDDFYKSGVGSKLVLTDIILAASAAVVAAIAKYL